MPESSEVKLNTEFLHKKLVDSVITSWTILGGKYLDNPPKGFEDFEQNLPMLVESVQCKGKFIYFTLYNEHGIYYALHSLGISGRWQKANDEYTQWCIKYDNNVRNESGNLWFRNPQTVATIEFTTDINVLDDYVKNLGPDILSSEFSLSVWKELIDKNLNKNITVFLMDQNILSGIGNRIKSECLYEAKISPLRTVGSLNEKELEKLYTSIRIIPRIEYNMININNIDAKSLDLKIYGKKYASKTKTDDGNITYWNKNIQI